jgi:hypothetical protein
LEGFLTSNITHDFASKQFLSLSFHRFRAIKDKERL